MCTWYLVCRSSTISWSWSALSKSMEYHRGR